MPQPSRAALKKHPHAIVQIEWVPNCRPSRDFEWFDGLEAMRTYFPVWSDHAKDSEHALVLAEVLDTTAMTLGQVVSFGADAERRAEMVKQEPERLIAPRRPKSRADIDWITDQLATGGDFSYFDDVLFAQADDLLSQRLGLIIDCRVEESDADVWAFLADERKDAPDYLHVPTDDREGWRIPPSHFDAAVDAAVARLGRGEKVFVHCHMGVNRGPSTAYAVLLAQGYGITEAFDMIRAARPIAGIAYAEDAVRWWAGRQGWDSARTTAALAELTRHVDAVLGPKDMRVIERAVRKARETDSREAEEIPW